MIWNALEEAYCTTTVIQSSPLVNLRWCMVSIIQCCLPNEHFSLFLHLAHPPLMVVSLFLITLWAAAFDEPENAPYIIHVY